MMLSKALGMVKHMLPASLCIFTLLIDCGKAVNRNNGLSLFLIRRLLLIAKIVTLPSMSFSHLEGRMESSYGFELGPGSLSLLVSESCNSNAIQ